MEWRKRGETAALGSAAEAGANEQARQFKIEVLELTEIVEERAFLLLTRWWVVGLELRP